MDAAAGAVVGAAARRRLIELAAAQIGRLRPDELPAALRPLARFTPRRLVQRGGPAIAAALDADEGFRKRVAEAVDEMVAQTLPALIATVHDGKPVAIAGDAADVAAAAYLLRPDGWQELLAAAAADATGAPARPDDPRPPDDRERLRAEVADLRARLKAETGRHRRELGEATASLEEEVAALRRELRARTGELRAAQRDLAAARETLATETARAERAAAASEADLRRLRGRVADLERAAGAERRSARQDRELADARLALLVDALQQAAAGVRAELALPPTALRPADTVAAATAAGGGATVDDAAQLDDLLRIPGAHLIVDGYNVTKTGYADLDLATQRDRLTSALTAVAGRSGAEVTIAFDGQHRRGIKPRTPRGVRVLFSTGEQADDLIRRLVAAEPPGRAVVVVTSDAAIVADVRAAGFVTAPSRVLLGLLG